MENQLSVGRKLGYGVADVGASLSFVAVNTWFFYFLVNSVGLEPFLAGLIFILGRLFDAILDPIMGVISDRLKPTFGRKRFIVLGAVPLGVSFALMWLSPGGSQVAQIFSSLFFFMLFSAAYTLVQVPYMALTPELAPDYDERTRLTSYRMGFGTFASLVAVALPPLIVTNLSGVATPVNALPSAWLTMGVIFGIVCSLAYLLAAASIREPARNTALAPTQGFWAEASSCFKVYGFRTIFYLFIIVTVGLMIVNSLLPFFLESNLGLSGDEQSLALGTFFGVAILVFPLWNLLGAKLGKRAALALGLGITALGALSLVGVSASLGNLGAVTPLLLTIFAFTGVGLSAVLLFPWAMLPDVVEFDELESGRRREGLMYALFTFGQKLAGSLSVFANGIVASVFGYQQGSALQTPDTLRAIAMMVGPVAALVFVCALILSLRFPITAQSHGEARAKLQGEDVRSASQLVSQKKS